MSEKTKVGEPKPGKGGSRSMRPVRRFRTKVAELHDYSKPERRLVICWIRCTTAARNERLNAWVIPGDIVRAVRNYSATHIGLIVEDGTKLLTTIDSVPSAWQPAPEGVHLVAFRQNGLGVHHYMVEERRFAVSRPDALTQEQALVERMRIPGRGR